MKATKNLNGAARAAVQAKLSAVEKELRKARDLVQLCTEELGRVRGTVARYTLENNELHNTIHALKAKQVVLDEFVEKLERELDIAEGQIQYHKERANTAKVIAYAMCGVFVALAWALSQHVGWLGGL